MSKTNHRDGTVAKQHMKPNYRLRKDCLKEEASTARRSVSRTFLNGVRTGNVDVLDVPSSKNRAYGDAWHWD